MKVDKNISVEDLKNSFIKLYPYLSLRVYKKLHDHYEGSPASEEVGGEVLLSVLNSELESGEVVISDSLSVDRLETIFRKEFGISVQVFRKSGDQWLQTTSTDKWTLERQNKKAEEYEQFVNNEK